MLDLLGKMCNLMRVIKTPRRLNMEPLLSIIITVIIFYVKEILSGMLNHCCSTVNIPSCIHTCHVHIQKIPHD